MSMYRKKKRVGHHRNRKNNVFFPLALHWFKRLCTKLFSLMVRNITSPLASLLPWERSGLFLDHSEAVWNSPSFFCWFPFDHSKVCGPCAWSALWDTPPLRLLPLPPPLPAFPPLHTPTPPLHPLPSQTFQRAPCASYRAETGTSPFFLTYVHARTHTRARILIPAVQRPMRHAGRCGSSWCFPYRLCSVC